jgi:hypothetical protein
MAYSLVVGGEKWTQVASISGWGDFRKWARRQKTPELRHLIDYGWSQDIPELKKQIEESLENDPPGEDVAGIASAMVKALESGPTGAESVVLTDGLTEIDDPDDSGWTSEED